jgi:hypothetical protein
MTRTLILATVTLTASFGFASAQMTTFTGPQGQNMGSAYTNGNMTTYTGPQGQNLGSSYSNGNMTTFTGPQGQYQGSAMGAPPPRRCGLYGC